MLILLEQISTDIQKRFYSKVNGIPQVKFEMGWYGSIDLKVGYILGKRSRNISQKELFLILNNTISWVILNRFSNFAFSTWIPVMATHIYHRLIIMIPFFRVLVQQSWNGGHQQMMPTFFQCCRHIYFIYNSSRHICVFVS